MKKQTMYPEYVEPLIIRQLDNGYEVNVNEGNCSPASDRLVFQSKAELLKHISEHFTFENKEKILSDV